MHLALSSLSTVRFTIQLRLTSLWADADVHCSPCRKNPGLSLGFETPIMLRGDSHAHRNVIQIMAQVVAREQAQTYI